MLGVVRSDGWWGVRRAWEEQRHVWIMELGHIAAFRKDETEENGESHQGERLSSGAGVTSTRLRLIPLPHLALSTDTVHRSRQSRLGQVSHDQACGIQL